MPAAARKTDPGVVHCSGYTIAQGSPDVLINGLPAARVTDPSTAHLRPGSPCSTHVATICKGSSTVFVNGLPLARAGDPLSGCTVIQSGSPDVFVG